MKKDMSGTKRGTAEERYPVEQENTLLEFLLLNSGKRSRNNIKSLLKRKQVFVDGQIASRFDVPLHPGQMVSIRVHDDKKEIKRCALEIVYEDDSVIVINKPSGLLSIASGKERDRTAYHLLMEYVRGQNIKNRIYIVHRLDRDTSGLMLFAKDEEIKFALQEHWKQVMVERGYTALVHGVPDKRQGVVKSWLQETKTHMMFSSKTPGDGLQAVTHYQVVGTGTHYSLVRVSLETGRKNQIRVHMKDIGHSIVGDKMYGSFENPVSRLCLHAHLLAFRHPVSGEVLRFESGTPKVFLALMRK